MEGTIVISGELLAKLLMGTGISIATICLAFLLIREGIRFFREVNYTSENKYNKYKILKENSKTSNHYVALVRIYKWWPYYAWFKAESDASDNYATKYKSLDALIFALENAYDQYVDETRYSLKRIL